MVTWGNGVPTKGAKTLGTFEIIKRGVIIVNGNGTQSSTIGTLPKLTNIIVSVRK